jgi:hypothetical protein
MVPPAQQYQVPKELVIAPMREPQLTSGVPQHPCRNIASSGVSFELDLTSMPGRRTLVAMDPTDDAVETTAFVVGIEVPR